VTGEAHDDNVILPRRVKRAEDSARYVRMGRPLVDEEMRRKPCIGEQRPESCRVPPRATELRNCRVPVLVDADKDRPRRYIAS